MSLDTGLGGKRVIVTGGAKGLGRALVVKLVGLGATVQAVDKNGHELESLKQVCPQVETVLVDLEDWEATRAAVEKIGPVDCLINNAAVLLEGDGFMKITSESFDRTFNVNLKAVVNVSQVVAQSMIDNGISGSIVNVSTVASIRSFPCASVHSMSKAALGFLTKLMAAELGPRGIRVNTVSLGSLPTDMLQTFFTDFATYSQKSMEDIQGEFTQRIPLRKTLVQLDDAVNTILFALSPALAATTTGTNFVVDGGFCIT